MNYLNKFLERNMKKAREKLSVTSDAISDKVTDMQYYSAKCVKKNPLKTVGLSRLVGIIISKLFQLRK
jgi:ElaB/YqjD/DUF883 family membrane-anchored ribosome-binding protein